MKPLARHLRFTRFAVAVAISLSVQVGGFGAVHHVAPKITSLSMDEVGEELHIVGKFDPTALVQVFVDGSGDVPLAVLTTDFPPTIPPEFQAFAPSIKEIDVMPNPAGKEVVCPLPANGSPSAGWIAVAQFGLRSNYRALTEWRGDVKVEGIGTGTLDCLATFNVHFRAYIAGRKPFTVQAASDTAGVLEAGGMDGGRSWSASQTPLTLVPADQAVAANQFHLAAVVNPAAIPAKFTTFPTAKQKWSLQLATNLQFNDTGGPGGISGFALDTDQFVKVSPPPAENKPVPFQPFVTSVSPHASLGLGVLQGPALLNADAAQPLSVNVWLINIPASFYPF